MTLEFLLSVVSNKWFILLLTIISYYLCWWVMLRLGVQILGEPISPKRIYPAISVMVLYAFARSSLSPYVFMALMVFIVTILLMFIVKRLIILKCIWASMLIYLISMFGDLILVFSVSSLNPTAYKDFFSSQFGFLTGIYAETFFPLLTLIILKKFKTISLVPSFKKIDFFNIVILVTFGSLFYIDYFAIIVNDTNFKKYPQNISANFTFLWIASIAATSGTYLLLRIMDKRNKIQQKQLELQERQIEIQQGQIEFEKQRREEEKRIYKEKMQKLEDQYQRLSEMYEQLQNTKERPKKVIDTLSSAMIALKNYYDSLTIQNESDVVFENDDLTKITFNDTEIAIIELILQGKTDKQIGKIIHLSSGRVSNIITDMLRRTGLNNRTMLAVRYALMKYTKK